MEIHNNNSERGKHVPQIFAGPLWTLGCLVFALNGPKSVFTGSGVASAKQTGHCGLNNCGLMLPSAVSVPLCMTAWMEVLFFIQTPLQCMHKDSAYIQAVIRLD